MSVKARDRYIWAPPLTNFGRVYVQIIQVRTSGHAVANCWWPGGRGSWRKRFPLPLPLSLHRDDWTDDDRRGLVNPGPHHPGCPVWTTPNGALDDESCDCDEQHRQWETPAEVSVLLPCDTDPFDNSDACGEVTATAVLSGGSQEGDGPNCHPTDHSVRRCGVRVTTGRPRSNLAGAS